MASQRSTRESKKEKNGESFLVSSGNSDRLAKQRFHFARGGIKILLKDRTEDLEGFLSFFLSFLSVFFVLCLLFWVQKSKPFSWSLAGLRSFSLGADEKSGNASVWVMNRSCHLMLQMSGQVARDISKEGAVVLLTHTHTLSSTFSISSLTSSTSVNEWVSRSQVKPFPREAKEKKEKKTQTLSLFSLFFRLIASTEVSQSVKSVSRHSLLSSIIVAEKWVID